MQENNEKIRCALFVKIGDKKLPNHRELQEILGKDAKVLFGGGKPRSSKIPYIDYLEFIKYAIHDFRQHLLEKNMYLIPGEGELYLFSGKVYASHLILKYGDQIVLMFDLDEKNLTQITELSDRMEYLKDQDDVDSEINSLSIEAKKVFTSGWSEV